MDTSERRILALILPRVPGGMRETQGVREAAAAQDEYEQRLGEGAPIDSRLRSVKLGEFSATLESTGLTREQALFPGGLCADARAILTDLGLFYRGVGA